MESINNLEIKDVWNYYKGVRKTDESEYTLQKIILDRKTLIIWDRPEYPNTLKGQFLSADQLNIKANEAGYDEHHTTKTTVILVSDSATKPILAKSSTVMCPNCQKILIIKTLEIE